MKRPSPIATLILALIIALTFGIVVMGFWSVSNRPPPVRGSAGPLVQGPAPTKTP